MAVFSKLPSYYSYLPLEKARHLHINGHVFIENTRSETCHLSDGSDAALNFFRSRQTPIIVSVEGNIGAGKTTALQGMVPLLEQHGHVTVINELVDEWRKNGMLEKMYQQPQEWAAPFQHLVLNTMFRAWDDAQKKQSWLTITDRSPQTSLYVFTEEARRKNFLTDADLAELQDRVTASWTCKPDLIVYVYTEPEVAYTRMRQRGRLEELDLNLDDMLALHACHNRWLLAQAYPVACPILLVDGNLDTLRVANILSEQFIKPLTR